VVIHGDADFVYVTNRCNHCNAEEGSDQAAYSQFFDPQVPVTAVTKGANPKPCDKGSKEKRIATCEGFSIEKAHASRVARDGSHSVKIENVDVDCTSSRYP